jgi:DNA replication and repair protein RecF
MSKPRTPKVKSLQLQDFRSYERLTLDIGEAMVVAISGDNGAGKTNILEALSLLSPGRGLRRADPTDLPRVSGPGSFAISIDADCEAGSFKLGTGISSPANPRRIYRINREPSSSAHSFANYLRIVWLTPAMDGLFTGSGGDRRRFLDRLVLAVDSEHGARVSVLEKALRSRNRLLEERAPDTRWLDSIEQEIAETAIAVTLARAETIERLRHIKIVDKHEEAPFPWADIQLVGELDEIVKTHLAIDAEEQYRRLLRESRRRDAAAGRTLIGPQSTDLKVIHGPKGIDARRCSTGEQKALLVGLVLAHANLVRAAAETAPIILLDEVMAHFDPAKRRALFNILEQLGCQVWVTGADPASFHDVAGHRVFVNVTPGKAEIITGI